MNVGRVAPRSDTPAAHRRVTFNPVTQVKTFTSSDPINATRPTQYARRLESILKTSPTYAKQHAPEKPHKPVSYSLSETPQKQKGRLMFWCAIGSLTLVAAFGPGALVITGICAFVSAIYFIHHERLINQGIYYDFQTHTYAFLSSTDRGLGDKPRAKAKTKDRQNNTAQYRQSANTYRESGTNPARNENRRAGTGTHRTYNHTSRHNHS